MKEISNKAITGIAGICIVIILIYSKQFSQSIIKQIEPKQFTKYQLHKDHHITIVSNTHCYFDTVNVNGWTQSIMIVNNDTIYGHKYKNYVVKKSMGM